MSILLGAALAVVWRPGRTSPVLRAQARVVISAAGVLGLVLLGWAFTSLGEYSPFLYRGGFLVVAGILLVIIAALVVVGGAELKKSGDVKLDPVSGIKASVEAAKKGFDNE